MWYAIIIYDRKLHLVRSKLLSTLQITHEPLFQIALLLAGMIALKKLLGQKGGGGGGGHESHGWSSGGGSGGGWDRRSITPQIQNEAQKLAYSSYVP